MWSVQTFDLVCANSAGHKGSNQLRWVLSHLTTLTNHKFQRNYLGGKNNMMCDEDWLFDALLQKVTKWNVSSGPETLFMALWRSASWGDGSAFLKNLRTDWKGRRINMSATREILEGCGKTIKEEATLDTFYVAYMIWPQSMPNHGSCMNQDACKLKLDCTWSSITKFKFGLSKTRYKAH